ncbi:hypothetical protein WSK_3204 [Novosphingobium sp. Rr 2-17]|uniref:esterase-like activity of phytase family protein n=1 Tax=Novosphingobium sp. Rr 2-17 TaxID=555793 RepID=UPI00026988BC|nr:esterase-like activity of phytase family protein [Novosphingobium sp. Rr 2-17]EIZ78229.1 hypothetical protein WSK_3204 [Novosphingobium sp. Rr 2-17]
MLRILASLFLALTLLPTIYAPPIKAPPQSASPDIVFHPIAVPGSDQTARLGVFRLEHIWHVTSPNWSFSGYSALLALPKGQLMALTDFSRYVIFTPPGAGIGDGDPSDAVYRTGQFGELSRKVKDGAPETKGGTLETFDTEGATRDPATGTIWQSAEGWNAIIRSDAALRSDRQVQPALMQGWGVNTGPESLVRLHDGRFVTVRERGRGDLRPTVHDAVFFDGDPIDHPTGHAFAFEGPENFSVTDMTQMPDGRILILMRRLIWPVPERFASRLVIADPSQIRAGGVWKSVEVSKIASTMPIDNFEGIAVVPRPDGRLTVWIIADDNRSTYEKTILWRLSVDPKELPYPRP